MKKRYFLTAAAAVFMTLAFCACGARSEVQEAAEAEPELTPEPTPVVSYTVTDESAGEILALAEISSLEYVDAVKSTEYAALLELYRARPDCEIIWNYEFEGVNYSNSTKELKVNELEGLEDALRYLPELTYVDVIDTPATVEDMDTFSAIRPDIDFYWSFSHDGFTIRTDIQCYSTLRDINYHRFTSEELYPLLKYCKHLKALDLGHNDLTDISLIGELKEMEVLILADNPNLVDASSLGNLENLVYLEFFMNPKVEDYSFLEKLTGIKDLNLCYDDGLTDLDFLASMPEITFCLLKYSGISQETFDYWNGQLPDVKMILHDGDIHSCSSGWRETERNAQIRHAFTCWRYVEEYTHYDDVKFDFSSYVY